MDFISQLKQNIADYERTLSKVVLVSEANQTSGVYLASVSPEASTMSLCHSTCAWRAVSGFGRFPERLRFPGYFTRSTTS